MHGHIYELLREIGDIDGDVLEKFRERVQSGKLVREENPEDHVCAYFVPVHKKTKFMYLGHHIKANEWIPPGGHIEQGEDPTDVVRREFEEELGEAIHGAEIALANLSVTEIPAVPGRSCRRHWDLWYTVAVPELTDYDFDTKEFYSAGWMNWRDGVKIMNQNRENYIQILTEIGKSL